MKNMDKSNISLRVAHIFESILAMVVLIAVFLGTIDVLRMIWTAYIVEYQNPVAYSQLNDILAQILLLVIAIEFVVMLSSHKAGTIVEVLLYAIARKMLLLPKSGGMLEILLGVISIGGLFRIRKHLLTEDNSNINITSINYDSNDDDIKDPVEYDKTLDKVNV
ncbi:phosphate-starvation-inducible PsiE family protein [Romboutsia sp. 13368]|uniref:phosphate-starvation-inducible PsiE family protein n=1 Tax=Romboutsia sp. 13368 TaxID=2708053 RepID=UPI0025DF581B|nr:phosphate-starvation-inducible PsiE family protein [Romboutsia sp. 13368]